VVAVVAEVMVAEDLPAVVAEEDNPLHILYLCSVYIA
jgi:hypothetical protein